MKTDGRTKEPMEIATSSALRGLRGPWRRLEESLGRPSPFLTWEWMWAWWRHLRRGEELSVLTLWDGDALIALAPFVLDGSGRFGARALRFLGADVTDDLDFVLLPSYESAIPLLLDASIRFGSWQLLDLRGIQEDSLSVVPIRRWTTDLSPWPPVIQFTPGLRLSLPATDAQYWGALSPRMRSKLRRGSARMRSEFASVRFRTVSTPEEVRRAMSEYLRLQRHRWSSAGTSLYENPSYCQFLRDASTALAYRGYTRLFQLQADRELLACALAFETPGRTLTYGIAVSPVHRKLEPGFLLLHHLISDAIERSGHEVDFLRGSEEYKQRLGGVPKRRVRIQGAAPGLRSRLAMLRL